MTFSEVRQYQFGDDVRNIDWNVTARYNEPFVKVFEEERELTLMLVAPQAAEAKKCTVDPFGAEVCLPDDNPEKPDKPKKSNDPPRKPRKSNDPGKPKDPLVIIPTCFGACNQFPPAPPYRQFEEAAALRDEVAELKQVAFAG